MTIFVAFEHFRYLGRKPSSSVVLFATFFSSKSQFVLTYDIPCVGVLPRDKVARWSSPEFRWCAASTDSCRHFLFYLNVHASYSN